MAAAFGDVIRLKLDKYSPEAAKQLLIERAKVRLGEFMARQANKPDVLIETDGRSPSTEEQVQPYGVITYRFSRLREACRFALVEAQRLSPRDSGAYAGAWFFLRDSAPIAAADIPRNGTVLLTNDRPYARKIQVGARGFQRYVPPGIVEKVRQSLLRRYGAIIDAQIDFVKLERGWVLRKDLYHLHKGKRYGSGRRDASHGMSITYPALRIQPKIYVG